MQVSKKCEELLHNFNVPSIKSNVLIADLELIQYGILDEENDKSLDYDNYWRKPLSKDMLELANEWKDRTFSEDLFLILNDNFKQIVKNDTTKYSAQMIFPIFMDNKLDGLAIFFKTYENHTKNNQKENSKNFDLNWFNKNNICLVDDKIEVYLSNLLDINEYLELNRKFQKLTLELTSTLKPVQRKLLMEYQNIELQISSYQNSLAYYLGLNEKSNHKIK